MWVLMIADKITATVVPCPTPLLFPQEVWPSDIQEQPASPDVGNSPSQVAIALPMGQIQTFCQQWQITEFALFGSILRDDFHPDSDIDILVTFAPNAQRGLTETLQMRDQLQRLFDRKVDLIVKAAIERSREIFP